MLNQVSGSRGGIVGVYQRHGWDKEKREALNRWADHVLALPKPQGVEMPTAEKKRKPNDNLKYDPDDLDGQASHMMTYSEMIEGRGGKAIAGRLVLEKKLGPKFLEAEAKTIEKRKKNLRKEGYDIENSTPLDLAMAETSQPDIHEQGYDQQGNLISGLVELFGAKRPQ